MMLCLLFVLFQETSATNNHGHEHGEDDGFVYFEPMSTGALVQHKNFLLSVPEGTFYTGEENVQMMLPLTGAEQIPNCVGIFYSNSNNWNYSAVVQHFGDLAFTLEPQLDPQLLTDFYTQNHLYLNRPLNGQADVVIPPTYQREENSFTLGMQYTEEDHTLVIIKKIYATQHGALIISYKGDDAAFQAEPEAIEKILHSVATDQNYQNDADAAKAPVSYLKLLGFNPQVTLFEPEAASEEMGKEFIILSVLLGLFGITMLILAFKFRKKPDSQINA